MDLFVTVKLLEDTPAVLSLGKFCADLRGHVTGEVFLFLEPMLSARQLSRSWSQV